MEIDAYVTPLVSLQQKYEATERKMIIHEKDH